MLYTLCVGMCVVCGVYVAWVRLIDLTIGLNLS